MAVRNGSRRSRGAGRRGATAVRSMRSGPVPAVARRVRPGPARRPPGHAGGRPAAGRCSRSSNPAPDGSLVVVVRRSVHGDAYRSHLWAIPLAGAGAASPLTHGAVRDTCPRVSPDGPPARVRPVVPRRPRPQARDPRHGAPRRRAVDRRPGRARSLLARVVPDGRRLAYLADGDPARFIVGKEAPGRSPTARVIRRIDWRWNEAGHRRPVGPRVDRGRPRGSEPATHDARRLGRKEPAWSPDGAWIAFAADRGPEADLRPRTTIWRVRSSGGEPEEIVSLPGPALRRPRGRPTAGSSRASASAWPSRSTTRSRGCSSVPADGSREAVALAPGLDLPVGAWLDTDLQRLDERPADRAGVAPAGRGRRPRVGARPLPPLGLPGRRRDGGADGRARSGRACGRSVLGGRRRGGRRRRARHPRGPGAGGAHVRGTRIRAPRPGVARDDARRRRPGPFEDRVRRQRACLPAMRNLLAPGEGGPIECGSPRPGRRGSALPTIVDMHGGPLGCWAPAPHNEVTMLVGAGYRVVLPEHPGFGRVRARLDPAAARRLGRGRCRRRPCRARPRRRARAGRPGAARRPRAVVRRLHGELARRHDRPVPRGGLGERRHEPGRLLGELRQRPGVLPGGAAGRSVHDPRASRAVAAVAAAPRRERAHAAADAPGRGRPALPAAGQRAVLRRAPPPAPRGRVRALPRRVAHVRDRPADPTAAWTAWRAILDWFATHL